MSEKPWIYDGLSLSSSHRRATLVIDLDGFSSVSLYEINAIAPDG
jgi:hypothetical protein